MEQFGELFQFLDRQEARDILLGYSTSEELKDYLACDKNEEKLKALCKYYNEDTAVRKTLVNLSADPRLADVIFKSIDVADALLLDAEDLGSMLLCNLCKVDECRDVILDRGIDDSKLKNPYKQYILVQLSTSKDLRVLGYIDHSNVDITDEHSMAVFKNLMFNVDNHNCILDVFPFDKLTSCDALSSTIVEFLLLSCTTLQGRQLLRSKNVYQVLKDAHASSSDDEYRELIERVVELLIRDEEQN